MQTLRQFGSSILLALISAILVIGGIMLSLAESYIPETPSAPTNTLVPVVVSLTSTATQLPPSIVADTPTGTATPLPTATFPPPTSCPPPPGWIVISVQPGQTLQGVAIYYHTTTIELMQRNCLFSENLPPNSFLYVPPIPTNTVRPCGPPAGWVKYTVQPGEYPYQLSRAFGITLEQFLQANCMSTSSTLYNGQQVWVPNVATRTPTLTPVSIIFATGTGTSTSTATLIPSATTVVTGTSPATSTATSTSTPTPTATNPPPTQPSTATPTITAFPSPTESPAP